MKQVLRFHSHLTVPGMTPLLVLVMVDGLDDSLLLVWDLTSPSPLLHNISIDPILLVV